MLFQNLQKVIWRLHVLIANGSDIAAVRLQNPANDTTVIIFRLLPESRLQWPLRHLGMIGPDREKRLIKEVAHSVVKEHTALELQTAPSPRPVLVEQDALFLADALYGG